MDINFDVDEVVLDGELSEVNFYDLDEETGDITHSSTMVLGYMSLTAVNFVKLVNEGTLTDNEGCVMNIWNGPTLVASWKDIQETLEILEFIGNIQNVDVEWTYDESG